MPCFPSLVAAFACATASTAVKCSASAAWVCRPAVVRPAAWPRPRRIRPRAGPTGGFGKAKACILVFNYGGPSHLDTWDLKPDAPPEIRGEFKPAATRVPGLAITEHLPRLGALANRYAILRSVTHRDNDHAIGAYLALTGYSHPKHAILGIEPPATPQDMPSLGSVLSKLRPRTGRSSPMSPSATCATSATTTAWARTPAAWARSTIRSRCPLSGR